MSDPAQNSTTDQPVAVVAGASGFIGQELCKVLHGSGYSVKALIRPHVDAAKPQLQADEVIAVDVGDSELVDVLHGANVVINLIGKAHTGVREKAALQSSNVDSAALLARASRAAAVPRFIHFSSILARTPEQSPYAASKLAGERAVLQEESPDFSVLILRPASVYGIGMRGNWMTLLRFIAARRMPPLPVLNNSVTLVSVQDLCQAVSLIAALPTLPAPNNNAPKIYPVSDGQHYTPTSLESAIYAALDRKKPHWHSPRVLFFAAAVLTELLARAGLTRAGFGLASYQNLISDSPVRTDGENELSELIPYQPVRSFFTELPALIDRICEDTR